MLGQDQKPIDGAKIKGTAGNIRPLVFQETIAFGPSFSFECGFHFAEIIEN